MTRWRKAEIGPRSVRLHPDPYFEWAERTDFVYYGPHAWVPVLIELKEGASAKKFARRVLELKEEQPGHAPPNWAWQLRIPPFYSDPPARLRLPTRHVSGLATRAFLKALYSGQDPSEMIERFEVGRAVTASSMATFQPGPPPSPFLDKRPKVVTGVIDDGIAYGHDCFVSKDGTTRIEYVWDQQEPSTEWDEWGYGRKITKRDPLEGIDKRRQESLHGGTLVHEDTFYRLTRHLDWTQPGHKPLAPRRAHGTHVADLACNSSARPAAGTRPIVAVQLPSATVEDTLGGSLGPQIYNGVAYILAMAEQIAADANVGELPVVVNVSYGMIAGPHDHSSLLERALDRLIESCAPPGNAKVPSLQVVLPAGNNHLSRCHARFSLDASKKSEELHWRVLPDDWTDSYLELWLPRNAALAITVTAPDGAVSAAVTPGPPQELVDASGRVVGQASYWPGPPGERDLMRLSIAPTGLPGGVPLAPAGLWKITVAALAGATVADIHAWIQRDDTAPGYRRRGRQSYFDDRAYQRYDHAGRPVEVDNGSYVKRAYTLNAIATGTKTIVVGGFRRSDGKPAPYSASGSLLAPRAAPNDVGPDAMAVSEDAPSHHGVLAAGTRSGSCTAMHGTSVSAPKVTLWLAQRMASGQRNDRKAVFDHAAAQEVGRVDTPAPERGGGGRIALPSNRPPR